MSEKKAEQINIQCARSTTSVRRGRYFVAFNGSKEKKEKEKKKNLFSFLYGCPVQPTMNFMFFFSLVLILLFKYTQPNNDHCIGHI